VCVAHDVPAEKHELEKQRSIRDLLVSEAGAAYLETHKLSSTLRELTDTIERLRRQKWELEGSVRLRTESFDRLKYFSL
jgi:hypothetical protein